MGAFGTMGALGQIANQVGDARELQRKRAQDALYQYIAQSQLGLSQSREKREGQEFDFRKQQANKPSYLGYVNVGGKLTALIQNPDGTLKTQQFDIAPGMDAWAQATQNAINSITDPKRKQAAQDLVAPYFQMGDYKGALSAVRSQVEKDESAAQAEKTRQDTQSAEEKRRAATQSDEDKRQQRSFAHQEKMLHMRDSDKETTLEKNTQNAIKDVLPMMDDLIRQLEPVKTQNSATDALAQRARWFQYRTLGKKIEDPRDQAIANLSAFIQIAGAQPWTRTGRGKYMFEQIIAHLPDPSKDTYANMYDKVQRVKGLLQRELDNQQKQQGGTTDLLPGEEPE